MIIDNEDLPLFSQFVTEIAQKSVKLNEKVPTSQDISFYFTAFYKPMINAIEEAGTESDSKTFYK